MPSHGKEFWISDSKVNDAKDGKIGGAPEVAKDVEDGTPVADDAKTAEISTSKVNDTRDADDFGHEEELAKLAARRAKREAIFKEKRQRAVTPGPGTNDLPTMFGGRIEDKFGKFLGKPSPNVRTAPAFSLYGRRADKDLKGKAPVGPGLYNPNDEALRKRSRGAVFGSQARQLNTVRKTVTPAPSLHIDGDDPRYSRSPRYGFGSDERPKTCNALINSQARDCQTPGPGDHNPNQDASSTQTSGQHFSFGRQPVGRQGQDQEEAEKCGKKYFYGPSPMNYEILPGEAYTVPATPRCCFGRSPRMGMAERVQNLRDTPGPGAYGRVNATRRGATADSAPKWSLTERHGRHALDFYTF